MWLQLKFYLDIYEENEHLQEPKSGLASSQNDIINASSMLACSYVRWMQNWKDEMGTSIEEYRH